MPRLILFALAGVTTTAQAADLYVCEDTITCSLSVECSDHPTACFRTIGDAVAAASDGDNLFLSAETYEETVELTSSTPDDLTLYGAGIGQTIVEGQTAESTFLVEDRTIDFFDPRRFPC